MFTYSKDNTISRSSLLPQQVKPTPFFQPKLAVNTPGDAHEREADHVADQVMRMRQSDAPIVQRMPLTPVSSVMRKCAGCEEKEKEGLQRKETSGGDASGKAAPSIVSNVLSSGGGQQMDGSTRQFMESRFGQDFSQVRIYTDARAAESASAIQARAYTSGGNVVFGSGEYQPGSEEGKRLLAHELVHVGQQGGKEIKRSGSIKFNNCTPLSLNNIAVIPEECTNYTLTPPALNNHRYNEIDGFWWRRSPPGRWFKVPGHCHVEASCVPNGLSFANDCTPMLGYLGGDPRWSNDTQCTEHAAPTGFGTGTTGGGTTPGKSKQGKEVQRSPILPIVNAASIVQRQAVVGCQSDVGTPTHYGSNCTDASMGLEARENEASGPDQVTSLITNSRRTARRLVNDAITILVRLQAREGGTVEAHQIFRSFFGGTGTERIPLSQVTRALSVFRQICGFLVSSSAVEGGGIQCSERGLCNRGALGVADCAIGSITRIPIRLCQESFHRRVAQIPETIIHEAAHRYGICPARDVPERYEGEEGFPTRPALRTSADSYSAFAREAGRLMGQERLEEASGGEVERPIQTPREFQIEE